MKRSLGSATFCALVLLLACGGESFTTDGGGNDGNSSDSDGSGDSSVDGSSGGGGTTSSGGRGTVGGSFGSGGSASGGNSGSGGSTQTCQDEPLHFELKLVKEGTHCTPICGTSFLKITDKYGKEIDFELGCGVTCDTCELSICPLGLCQEQMPVTEPLHQVWSGTSYVADTCGEAMAACVDGTCAKPGAYVAHFCLPRADNQAAEPVAICPEDAEVDCVEVEFEWPRSEPVEATLDL